MLSTAQLIGSTTGLAGKIISSGADGSFSTIWHTYESRPNPQGGAPTTIRVLYAKSYDASGAYIGADKLLLTALQSSYVSAAVERPNGGFLIPIASTQAGGTWGPYNLDYLTFNAANTQVGSATRVNTGQNSDHSNVDIAFLNNGGKIVSWSSGTSSSYVQQMNANDSLYGPMKTIVGYSNYANYLPANETVVTSLGNGGYMVVFENSGSYRDSIFTKVFNATGRPIGAVQNISTDVTGASVSPEVASLANGKTAVFWHGPRESSIFMQVISANGNAVGAVKTIATYGLSYDTIYAVDTMEDGGFVAVWDEYLVGQIEIAPGVFDPQNEWRIFGIRFDANGARIGNKFEVTFIGDLPPSDIDVHAQGNGGFVISWASPYNSTITSGQVYAPQYFGTRKADIIHDNSGIDQIYGRAGDDSIWGLGGQDVIFGQAGNDTINGGSGDDTLRGGVGNDILRGDAGADLLVGGAGEDQLFGGTGNDRLLGRKGNDQLNGEAGDDHLVGGPGDDILSGGAGADILFGGLGNDTLNGGTGNDILVGKAGVDQFVFNAGFGQDIVRDFADNQDTLVLSSTIWGGGLLVSDVVANFASVVGGDTILNFGTGDVITLKGLADANALLDDITIL